MDLEKINKLNRKFYNKGTIYGMPFEVGWTNANEADKRYNKCLEMADITDYNSILDVGCGTGIMYKYLDSISNNFVYFGIDKNDFFIDFAISRNYNNAKFKVSDFSYSKFKNVYDVLFAIGSFYTIGLSNIDEQYEYLYNMINKSIQVSKSGVISLLVDPNGRTFIRSDRSLMDKYMVYPENMVIEIFNSFNIKWIKYEFKPKIEWILHYIV